MQTFCCKVAWLSFAICMKLLSNLQDSKHCTEIIFQDICLVKASSHKAVDVARRMKYWQAGLFAISIRAIPYIHVMRCFSSFIRLKLTVSVFIILLSCCCFIIDRSKGFVVVKSKTRGPEVSETGPRKTAFTWKSAYTMRQGQTHSVQSSSNLRSKKQPSNQTYRTQTYAQKEHSQNLPE